MKIGINRLTICIAAFSLAASLQAQREGPLPPSSVSNLYNGYNAQLSDNFNGSDVNWSKWTRRQTNISSKGSLQDWRLSNVNGGWARLNGKKINGNWVGNGLCAKPNQVYNTGFIVSRWKFSGQPSHNRTIFHPSIWSANWNNGYDSGVIPTGPSWLEIDMMEYESWPHYAPASHLVPRVNGSIPSGSARPKMYQPTSNTWYTGVPANWSDQIWGLEYHVNYIQTWKYVNGTWNTHGQKVWTSWQVNWDNNRYSHAARKKMYWILSNITPDWQRASSNNVKGDTFFAVNYFEYYPAKSLLP
ncbi:MAG: hypothetical protein AAFX93_17125 [Verrucomicrobiota bacterium]